MFFLLRKPAGISSAQLIAKFAKETKVTKIGHAGTLDPLATGLLLVATDEDTPLLTYVDRGWKTYVVQLRFGATSDTYDVTGQLEVTSNRVVSLAEVKDALGAFVGTITQIPPAFSAKKVAGKPAYLAARQGKPVSLKSIEVQVAAIEDLQMVALNEFTFTITVSRGTYIRTLVHDLGQALQTGAVMVALERTRLGNLTLEDDKLSMPLAYQAVLDLPNLDLRPSDLCTLIQGKPLMLEVNDDTYLLMHKALPVGVIVVQNQSVTKRQLIGKRLSEVCHA